MNIRLSSLPLIALAVSQTLQAAEPSTGSAHFQIPPNSLDRALVDFSLTSGIQVVADGGLTAGIKSPGVTGQHTATQALDRLLVGTGMKAQPTGRGTVLLAKAETPAGSLLVPPDNPTVLPAVIVKGKTPEADAYSRAYSVPVASTATKTDTPLMDTPAAVQVIPQQVLQDQQAWRLEDAVKNVSGVQPVWTSGGIGQDYVIRGFGTNYTRFRNGIRLSGFNSDLANVERVEVLKGQSSMLYGRIEPGGMVNVVTKRPQDAAHYSLQQQFGSYDFYRTVAEATGPVFDSLSYRLDLDYTNRGSFRDFVRQEQIFIAPSLHWQASDATEFNLNLEYQDRDLPYDTGIPAVGNRVANVPISNNYGQPGGAFNRDPSDSTLLDFNWSHAFNDDWKIQNGFVGNWVTNRYREILVAIFQPLLEAGNNPLQVRRGSQFEDRSEDTYSVYFNLSGKFDTGFASHKTLLGWDYYKQQSKTWGFFGYNAANAPAGSPYHYDGDFGGGNFAFTRVNLYNPVYPALSYTAYDHLRKTAPNDFVLNETAWNGLYFQDQISFLEGKLQVLGGGRYDWASQVQGLSNSADDGNAGFTTGTPSFANRVNTRQSEGHFNPRVGILYRPWTWLSVYGNWVEGFGLNNGRSATGAPLKPEISEQFEAGFKTEALDGKLRGSLAYFHIEKTNIKTLLNDGGIFGTIGKARSQGIELDLAGEITDGLSLIATYAYTDARITADGSATANNQGHRMPNVPEHSGSTWLKYTVQEGGFEGLSFGIGAYFAGQRQGDNANSYQLPGYARLDTYAGYTANVGPTRLTAQLNVNNVLDKRYYVAGQPYYANRAWNMPADPLMLFGSLKLEY